MVFGCDDDVDHGLMAMGLAAGIFSFHAKGMALNYFSPVSTFNQEPRLMSRVITDFGVIMGIGFTWATMLATNMDQTTRINWVFGGDSCKLVLGIQGGFIAGLFGSVAEDAVAVLSTVIDAAAVAAPRAVRSAASLTGRVGS